MWPWLKSNWWLLLAGIAMAVAAYLFGNYVAQQVHSHPELWREL